MYLNLRQMAESFGVSERVVEDWIRNDGLPHTPDRGRLLFDRARVAHWADSHGLTAKAGFLAPQDKSFAGALCLERMLRAGGIWREAAGPRAVEVFGRVIGSLAGVPQAVRTLLAHRLGAKDGINWAPVGGGYALPHFSTRVTLGRDAGVIVLLLLDEQLPLAAPPSDGVPVTRLFFFVPPFPRAHLQMLGRLSHLLAKGPLRGLVDRDAPDDEIFQAFKTAGSKAADPNSERVA